MNDMMKGPGPNIKHFRDAVEIMIKEIGSQDVIVPMVDDTQDEFAFMAQLFMKLLNVTDNLNSQYKLLVEKYEKLKNKKKLRADKKQRNDKVVQVKAKLEPAKDQDKVAHAETIELKREKVEKEKSTIVQHNFTDVNSTMKIQTKHQFAQSNKIPSIKEQFEAPTYTCDNCRKSFSRKDNLSTHISRTCIKNKLYTCTICKISYSYPSALSRHRRSHNGRTHSCYICDKIFHSYTGLYRHKKIVHQGFRYECSICHKQYTKLENRRHHINFIHKGIKYTCPICNNKSYATKAIMLRHAQSCQQKIKK